ncbi:hypothetical protein E2C01_089902 [Portunus trituberculatus]|uniref:Uncharacterized protein n=1 Tax=Portunus trituberculatus TaxID=210409 RepID=A0A5B7JA25_PORTR|nr:hypothetical protein [Portunus trituberculatus]
MYIEDPFFLATYDPIQKRCALSSRQFSKATGMISEIFKNVSPVNNVKILSLCL